MNKLTDNELMLQNIDCGISVYAIQPDQSLKIMFVNEGFCKLLEGTREELEDAFTRDSLYGITTEYKDKVLTFFRELIPQRASGEIVFRGVTMQKKYKWITLKVSCATGIDGEDILYATYFDNTNQIEKQKMLDIASKHVGMWYWIYNLQENTCYLCESVQKEFGVSEIMKNPVETWIAKGFIDQKYVNSFRMMVDRIKSGQHQAIADCKGHLVDGSVHWTRYFMTAIEEVDGKITKAVGTAQLIDDLKEFEEKYEFEWKKGVYRDEELMAHSIYNLSQRIPIEQGYEKLIEPDVSLTSLQEIAKVEAEFIISKSARQEFINLHDEKNLLRRYDKGEQEITKDYRCKMMDGRIRWIRDSIRMMRQPRGTDILLFEYSYDVNKIKSKDIMMDFTVNDEYDLLGSVHLEDNTAVMLYGPESYNIFQETLVEDDYTISLLRFANNAIVKEEREEYLKKASISHIKEVLAKQNAYEFYFHMRKDGCIKKKRVRYVNYVGDPNVCLFIQNDITDLVEEEQKKQELLRKALKSAEQANHYKSIFLSQMSHEIRTPMNAIIGMAKLARDTTKLEEKNQYIDKIENSSNYLLGLINDILDMSKIENGKFVLHPTWVSSSEILHSCIDMLIPAMAKKGITFDYMEGKNKDNLEFYLDSMRMRQVFMNLLNNAMKFTPTGGRIELKFENIRYDSQYSTDKITISDTGCGMSKDFLTRIFQPFEQEANEYSGLVQGTGLGLALVKQIVTAMNGNIQVQSELGKGSTFTLIINYQYRYCNKDCHEQHGVSEHVNAQDISFDGKRFLLVEDHPLNREIAIKLLQKKGAIVDFACDGKEGVDAFEKVPVGYYQLVLMDIRMPLMDGLTATRMIRKSKKEDAERIPIIAMTANAFEEDVENSLAAGMNDHLAKPIEPKKMYETIAMWLAKSKI